MQIGILGLQGACRPHEEKFAQLGVATRRVINPWELREVDGLVIPGGESTVMLKMAGTGLWEELVAFGQRAPVWGVCAGCILVAKRVTHPEQPSLDLLDLDVVRNYYGAQNESFIAPLTLALDPEVAIRGIFIRAPRISRIGPGVRILATQHDDPVMVEEGRHLATTFHPELTETPAVHQYFLRKVSGE